MKLGSAGEPELKTRPRPSAGNVAMAVAVWWLLLPCALAAMPGRIVISLSSVAPLIVATAADQRRTAIVAGVTVVPAIAAGARQATDRMRAAGAGVWRSAP